MNIAERVVSCERQMSRVWQFLLRNRGCENQHSFPESRQRRHTDSMSEIPLSGRQDARLNFPSLRLLLFHHLSVDEKRTRNQAGIQCEYDRLLEEFLSSPT